MKLGNKISKIISMDEDSYSLKVKFSDGAVGEVDLGFIFDKPENLALEVLKGGLFKKCYLESGALAWPNGLELCPDSLRMKLATKKKAVLKA
jgi:hypothetical protein